MKISAICEVSRVMEIAAVLVLVLMLGGCSRPEEKPAAQEKAGNETAASTQQKAASETPRGAAKEPAKKTAVAKEAQPAREEDMDFMGAKQRDLGQPLVDNAAKLVRLDKKQPVWVDRENKQVVLLGEVCKADYPLEFFATYANRSYEAVMSINVKPSTVHAGLVVVGAEPGHPAQFQPEFVPPTGTEVAIDVRWRGANGKIQSAPAQKWIRNVKTKKPLDINWVFAGSMVMTDETTGRKYYQADSGELICVLSLPTAMLDLPIRSYGAIEDRMFEAFTENLPPPGTPITVLLKPVPPGESKPVVVDTGRHDEEEKKARECAEPWLALVDQEQYAKSWETAAELLKNAVPRRDFVKSVSAARKPLGKLKTRVFESAAYTSTAPGMPDGKYVILQYKSSFDKKEWATETITPMLDKDKKWRVSGYYVK